MKQYTILVSFILTCLLMMSCDESGDKVIGSQHHDIQLTYTTESEILANGISTTFITAFVTRSGDGEPAGGMRVHFETTAGSIEEYATTNEVGGVRVVLTSAASDTDCIAEITAIVLDPTFSPLNKNEASPYSITLSVPDSETKHQKNNRLKKVERQQDYRATIHVKFIGVTFQAEMDETVLPADGMSRAKIDIRLRETTSLKPIKNTRIYASTFYGSVQGIRGNDTDDQGYLNLYLIADEKAGEDTLQIVYGKIKKQFFISYVNPKLTLSSKALQTLADGESKIQVVANLLSYRNTPIEEAVIKFSTSAGIIPESAMTDENGNAIVDLIAGNQPDSAVVVTARFHALSDNTTVKFVENSGNSILLTAEPNFIWVKETGNVDQTIITATVLGINNQPLGNDIGVKFYIVNGPGEETIEPSSGSTSDSTTIVPTVNGISQATIRSGKRSGTVKIKAKLVDYPNIQSQTTNIVIRSGPPYMWLDSQKNNVVRDTTTNRTHTTLAVECGKHNVAFTNPIQDIQVTAYFGDKYNNPVEEGTAVYFTTTGGIITSDAITNDRGQTSVVLQNVNPFPKLVSSDSSQIAALTIRNPNDLSKILDIDIPDYEGGEVFNSIKTYAENDGNAIILAYTWGQDQQGNLIKVWTTARVIFSVGVKKFFAFFPYGETELKLGQSAEIFIQLYDDFGNPVAAGSVLTASTNAGELSETNLLPQPDRYGYGRTWFRIFLKNDLKPEEDKPTLTTVKLTLDSPNGSGTFVLPSIYLKITP